MKAPKAYWIDFAVYPMAGAIALSRCDWSARSTWTALICGFLLFTFLEYWIHRVVLHGFFYHGRHERHHTHPEEYVVFPIWYVPAIFACFFVLLPLPVFAGFCYGYFWFTVWHDALHHHDLDKRPFVKRYAAWHNVHHKNARYNFGITVPIWDVLFGTYRRP